MASKLFATPLLAQKRRELGFSQKEMAWWLKTELGKRSISVSAYMKWEYGTRPVTPGMAVEVARLLKVELESLWQSKTK